MEGGLAFCHLAVFPTMLAYESVPLSKDLIGVHSDELGTSIPFTFDVEGIGIHDY